MPNGHHLDQAIDNYAASGFLEITGYEEYLEGPYWQNRMSEERKPLWDEHYARMNQSTMHALLRVVDEGVRLRDVNLLYMGPGFHPVGNEISRDTVEVFLKHVNSVVLCDISQKVVLSARKALVEAGVPSHKILLAQYDISDGMGTVYNDIIDEELRHVTTEDQLDAMSEKIEKLTIDDIRRKLVAVMKKRKQVSVPNIIGGGINDKRSLRFTIDGERLPIHLAIYQMVFAGTGAAAEGKIWERFAEVTSDTEHGARKGDQHFNRSLMRSRFYRMIQRFNTAVTIRHMRKLFKDNADAPPRLAQGFTDINTTYDDEGELARLNVEQMKWDLEQPGDPEGPDEMPDPPIRTTIKGRAFWRDERDHGHGTVVLQCRLDEGGSGVLKRDRVSTRDVHGPIDAQRALPPSPPLTPAPTPDVPLPPPTSMSDIDAL